MVANWEDLIDAAHKIGRRHNVKVHLTLKVPVDGIGGEGLWALVDDETNALYNSDTASGRCKATINNDSIFYDELYAGAEVEIQMMGERRPEIVVPADWKPGRPSSFLGESEG